MATGNYDSIIRDEWKNQSKKSWGELTVLEYSKSVGGWRLYGKTHDCQQQVIDFDDRLEDALVHCGSTLTHLDLRSLFFYDFESPIIKVNKYCRKIQYIHGSEQLWITAAELISIMKNSKHLTELVIPLIESHNEMILAELLGDAECLKYFALSNEIYTNHMTGMFLESLPISTIEEINLTKCVALIPRFFNDVISRCTGLRALTLRSCNFINNAVLKGISQVGSLTKLNINNIPSICAYDFNNHLRNLRNIEELSLTENSWLNDEYLINISLNCKQIKLLDVSLCVGLTNRGISGVINLEKLQVLRVNWVFRITDEPLGELVNLRELSCSGCHQIRDAGVIRLIRLAPYLTRLNVSQCAITNSTIEAAIAITKKRQSNIILEVNVCDTQAKISDCLLLKTSPLLRIIKC